MRREKSGASPAASAASLIRERRRSSSKGKVGRPVLRYRYSDR